MPETSSHLASPAASTPGTDTNTVDVQRLRALLAAATPGPWTWRGHDDGQVELRGHGPFGRSDGRVVTAMRSEPCIVQLANEDIALTFEACDSCREMWDEITRTGNGDLAEGYRCPKPENLGTVWLNDRESGSVRPANTWAMRQQPYRSDVAAVDHPDAELIAEAVTALPALLDAADRLSGRARLAEAALIELLQFVVAELDQNPAPWPSYFAQPEHIVLAKQLQVAASPSSDEASDVPAEPTPQRPTPMPWEQAYELLGDIDFTSEDGESEPA